MPRWIALVVMAGCGFAPRGSGTGPEGTGDDARPGMVADARADLAVEPPPCPPTYTASYRLIATTELWLTAEQACEADAPGAAHLVVLDDDAERATIATLIQSLPGDAWVGIVRDPGGTSPWPWRLVTGGPATYAPWESTEPNNMSGNQYVGVMRKSSGQLFDYGVDQVEYAVCECDRRAAVNADYDPAT
jgi:Lectin C-type domain